MININDYDILRNNRKSLKELSEDTANSEYMTESTMEAIDFDTVKESYTRKLKLPMTNAFSVDAILCKDNKIIFIEFKNGFMEKATIQNVHNKVRDSLLILNAITNINVCTTQKEAEFILVYNERKNNSKKNITNSIMKKAKKEMILFGLHRFETLYFKDVHTYTKQEFNQYIKKLIT